MTLTFGVLGSKWKRKAVDGQGYPIVDTGNNRD